jgi:TRAP-type C4-dicarboxylate transport system permease small subunit
VHRVARFFDLVAGLLLAAMVVVTCIDVVGRYLFNRPMKGAFELTEVLMAALIFAALPAITARREHIAVDLLDRYFSRRAAQVRSAVIELGSAVVVGALAYIFFEQAKQTYADGLYTQALQISLAPVVFFAMGALAVAAILHLLVFKRGVK